MARSRSREAPGALHARLVRAHGMRPQRPGFVEPPLSRVATVDRRLVPSRAGGGTAYVRDSPMRVLQARSDHLIVDGVGSQLAVSSAPSPDHCTRPTSSTKRTSSRDTLGAGAPGNDGLEHAPDAIIDGLGLAAVDSAGHQHQQELKRLDAHGPS